ncbi:MAG: flavodoxin family protein [Lentisphaeria bacterium]|nr:flavodoxin family protein [Lentisphaeria bacterium]
MKVLLVNGSPHSDGCICTDLKEVAETLKKEGVESEIFWIGNKPVQGCAACFKCRENGADGCVFSDQLYRDLIAGIKECDGIIIGSPVYYAGPAGSLCAILDRIFFSGAQYLKHKPAACIVNARRGGASAAFDRLNKYFSLLQMPIATSSYWNSTHGTNPQEVVRDLEGMQVIRTLARNMAYLLKSKAESGVQLPEQEEKVSTNFIS